MNWSKMILPASLLAICMIFGQTAFAQAPAGKGKAKQEMNDKAKNQGTDKAAVKEAKTEIPAETDGEIQEMKQKTGEKQAKASEQAGAAKEGTPKGNAYGKNKGDLQGKEFGQARAAEARSKGKGKGETKSKEAKSKKQQ